MTEPSAAPKIGATHLAAFGRAGLKEITQILPAFPDSVQPVDEIGLAGNSLPQDIYNARHQETPAYMDTNLEMQM